MYDYCRPDPLVIPLIDAEGYRLRQVARSYIDSNLNITGAERASEERQGFGALAEIVTRNKLGLSEINNEDHPLGFDFSLPSGVKVDVKCRGGDKPFSVTYEASDGIPREAKHNFFARQLFDDRLDADIFLLTHLQKPKKSELPGTTRQRKWVLFICGWVSKKRVIRDGVFLPRGAITESGRTWFDYKGQEIEFYNKNLNGLHALEDLMRLDTNDVIRDEAVASSFNLTSADAARIIYDLIGRSVFTHEEGLAALKKLNLEKNVSTILHVNQYFHLVRWLKSEGVIGGDAMQRLEAIFREEFFSGI